MTVHAHSPSLRKTLSSTRVAMSVWAALVLGLAGCTTQGHSPALLPVFMDGAINFSASAVRKTAQNNSPGHPPVAELDADVEEDSLPSPASISASECTLDQAIRECLAADPKIRAEWESVNQAQAEVLTSSLPPNPSLWTDFQLLPLTHPFTLTRQGGPPQADYQVTFPIDWYLFGKRAAAIVSAKIGVDVAAAGFADVMRQRMAATMAAYYDALEAQTLLGQAREDLVVLKQLQRDQQKAKAGDPDRVRAAILEIQGLVRERERTAVVTRAKLGALMGRWDMDPNLRVAGSLDVAEPAEPPSTARALAVAEEARPDLVSLRRQITQAEADIHTEKTKAYPPVKPTLGYSRQFQQKVIEFSDANSYTLAFETDLPFFNRNQGNIRKAQSVLVQKHLKLQTKLVDLRAEITEAVEEFRLSSRHVRAIDPDEINSARAERDRIVQEYQKGDKTLVEALEAQRVYRETVRQNRTTHATYWKTLHRLNAVLGQQVLR